MRTLQPLDEVLDSYEQFSAYTASLIVSVVIYFW